MLRSFFRINNKQSRNAFLLFLAVLYSAGSLQIDSLHRLLHQHGERALHTPEQEQNPCHRVVFHDQPQGSCEHPTHFSESKKCPLCQGAPTHTALKPVIVAFEPAAVAFVHTTVSDRADATNDRTLLPARAPPVMG
ncbi:MAG: hypothetical protein ACKO3B_09630 [Bacteroidota bacterium]